MLDPSTVVSISELNRHARDCLEREFPLLWVAGEVSNLTRATSGHVYFSLKDEAAQARCVMFRSRAQALPWKLDNGTQVEARALVSLYEARGEFQLNVETLRRAGLGRLFERFARLKQQLEAEGLFATNRKRPLPRFPRCIGIVCSPRAAAVRDVLVSLARRAPHLDAILYPSLVQGNGAASEIAAAIALAGRRRECDLLLVVRGGGSIEDLWAFNEEAVARALGASPLVTICGIGHESDSTIADFVADLRAPTPTAAAELATQGWHEAEGRLEELRMRLRRAMNDRIALQLQGLDHLSLRLTHPAARLAQAGARLALLSSRLDASMARESVRHRDRLNRAANALGRNIPRIEHHHGRLTVLVQRLRAAAHRQHQDRQYSVDRAAAALKHLDPKATLSRGFSIIRDSEGRLVTDSEKLMPGQTVSLHLANGEALASILATDHGKHPFAI